MHAVYHSLEDQSQRQLSCSLQAAGVFMKSLLFVITIASTTIVAALSGVKKLQEDRSRRTSRRRWHREIQQTADTEDTVKGVLSTSSFKCDIPSSCQYGLFNTTSCTCDCIQPFCTDVSSGECTTATQCSTDPFKSCVQGLNCPWWVNHMNSESCTTGPSVSSMHK